MLLRSLLFACTSVLRRIPLNEALNTPAGSAGAATLHGLPRPRARVPQDTAAPKTERTSISSLPERDSGIFSQEHLYDPTEDCMKHYIRKEETGFPWRLSVKESACQFRRHRFQPWSRKIPHAVEQLSPCATATEAQALRSLCPVTGEAPAHHN